MLCTKGEKDDEKKKGPLAKCGAKAPAQSGRTVEERNKSWRASNSPGKEQSWKSKMRSKILETKATLSTVTMHDGDREWQEYMLEECSDDSGVNNDGDEDESEEDSWDLVPAKAIIADMLAIARQERVATAKEYEENKQKLLKDMKEFYAGKVEEEEFYAFKAEDPEEEPKASGSRARMRRKKPASSKAARSKRLRRMAQQGASV